MHSTDDSFSPDRWQQADRIFVQALERPSAERADFVAAACGGDEALRLQVERLLVHATGEDDLLPPGELLEALKGETSKAETLPAGTLVDRYRILEEIGRGGMAVVYLAERADGQYVQQVALKVVKRGIDTDEVVGRFRQERQILARLRHPHIAQLLDGGTTADGRPYFVLEHVAGRPIDRYCDEERLSVEQRLRLFLKAARAVQHAHRHLVVHRDIKPSNLLVDRDGEPKLLDFGIAKLLTEETAAGLATRTSGRVMTPAFASPEQVRGEALTTASDVYQLGLLLYLLLAGRWPYGKAEGRPEEMARAICHEPPTRPSAAVATGTGGPAEATSAAGTSLPTPEQLGRRRRTSPQRLRRELAGDLDNVVLMALRKEPERRYGSVALLMEDVERFLEGRPVAARPATLRYRTAKFLRRHAVASTGAALVVVLLAGLGTFHTVSLARERDRARQAAEEARAVSTFLTGLFEVAAPSRSRGEQITARQILDRGAHWIGEGVDGQAPLQGSMMTVVGGIYRELALYDEAEPLLEEAVALRRAESAPNKLPLAEALDALARLRADRGEPAEARALFEEALALREAALGPDDPLVAQTLDGLGRVLGTQGEYEAAREHLRRALAIFSARPGSDRGEVGRTLHHLATVAIQSHEIEEARELLVQAVTRLGDAYETDHPYVVAARADLADVLARGRNYPQARAEYQAALPLLERAYGAEHPLLAASLGNYGSLLSTLGEHDEALKVQQRSLTILESTLGPGHPEVAEAFNRLGLAWRARGGMEGHRRASEHFQRSAEITAAALGPRHPRRALALLNLAEEQVELGEDEPAAASFEAVIEIREEAFGAESAGLLEPLLKLGRLRLAQGKAATAEPLLRRALELGRLIDPHGTHGTTMPQIALGRCLVQLDQLDEADTLLGEILAREDLETFHPEVLRRLHTGLAELAEARRQPAEARRWRAALAAGSP